MSSLEGSGLMESDALDKQIATGADVGTEKTLQEKFVTYVQALTGSADERSSVWMEHSYARARRGGGAAPRTLLVRRGPVCPDCHLEDDLPIDVDTVEEPLTPPLPPSPPPPPDEGGGGEELANWEEELEALAPTPTHRRLAASALELVRSLRAARLAGAPRAARAHARRLRRELAPLWAHPGPLQQRPAAWMHGALSGYLPRPYLDVYNDMVAELARAVPRLVERLLAGQVSDRGWRSSLRAARAHARRLRRELAPLWAHPGPLQQRPAAWMHGALSGYLPRPYLDVYNDMVAELARAVPRLVERLLAGQVSDRGWRSSLRAARAHARRLRRELAPLWAHPGPLQQRPAAWMHGALSGYLPRPYLDVYNDMVAELARAVPRLVERLLAGQVSDRGWRSSLRAARAHARRLRRELAPLWAHPGPLQQRPAAWMHGALSGYLPRPYLDVYNDMVAELARAVPRLVERLLAGQVSDRGWRSSLRAARAHARRLRRELAPLWAHPGPLQQRPAAWMHGALSGYLPRPYLDVYNDMVAELARAVPRLVERLLAGQVSDRGWRSSLRAARAHARRLRRELAPLWAHPGPLQQRPAAWMHGALSGYLPRPYLDVYNDMVAELARAVPRLVERLLAGQVAAAPAEPEATGPRAPPAADRPLLVWLPSGRERRDELWERRLRHLLPVHRIRAPVVAACSPEAWCTSLAAAARAGVAALAGTPRSALALAGWGAGAALAVHLAATWDSAAGPPPRCLALLSPPLLTAEGPRDSLDDPLLDLKVPVLFVVGQNAMQCTVGIAEEVRSRLGAWSRLVVVGGADDALRLTHQKLRMERVTQQMVDAALAEEVRGFVAAATRDDADGCREPEWGAGAGDAPPSPPSPPRRRRAVTPPPHARRRYGTESPPPAVAPAPAPSPSPPAAPAAPPPSAGKGRGLALLRVSSAPLDASRMHSAGRGGGGGGPLTDWEEALAAAEGSHKPMRNIRITDSTITHGITINGGSSKGFSVVARGTGSVPLCLPPPRRTATAAAAAAPLAPADIMQLPIVFADDDDKHIGMDAPATPPTPSTVSSPQITSSISVRSATPLKYTKVILAKRMGVVTPGSAGSSVVTTAGGTVSVGTSGGVTSGAGTRPIIVKGGLRIMPKTLVIKRNATSPVLSPSPPKKSPEDQSPV